MQVLSFSANMDLGAKPRYGKDIYSPQRTNFNLSDAQFEQKWIKIDIIRCIMADMEIAQNRRKSYWKGL